MRYCLHLEGRHIPLLFFIFFIDTMFFAIFISFSLLEGIITHLALRLDDELKMTPANHVNDRYGILVGKRD